MHLIQNQENFYPRSPHGERLALWISCTVCIRFLSTLSAWRATTPAETYQLDYIDFYPRSPHGERRFARNRVDSVIYKFLSTLSAWRATIVTDSRRKDFKISIHALRMESDRLKLIQLPKSLNFYPRSPHGERRDGAFDYEDIGAFLSTLSAWRATVVVSSAIY